MGEATLLQKLIQSGVRGKHGGPQAVRGDGLPGPKPVRSCRGEKPGGAGDWVAPSTVRVGLRPGAKCLKSERQHVVAEAALLLCCGVTLLAGAIAATTSPHQVRARPA
jgi:hypothetical protein